MGVVIVAIINLVGIIAQSLITNRREKKSKLNEKIDNLAGDVNLLKSNNLAITRSQIVSKCDHYKKQGFMPEYARFCLEELYKNYKKLGGNHGIEVLVDETFRLPLTKEKQ